MSPLFVDGLFALTACAYLAACVMFVAFLASDQASYVTGETLRVNGGMYM